MDPNQTSSPKQKPDASASPPRGTRVEPPPHPGLAVLTHRGTETNNASQQRQQMRGVRVVFNPSHAAGLMALSEDWGISPVAVARRIVREALRNHDVLDRPPRSSPGQDNHPGMVHRTLRITAKQASFVESTAYRYRLNRSEVIRGVLTHAIGQTITHGHLRWTPSERRTVRWSVRITPCHDAHIRRVAELLKCSETDAAAGLLSSMAARRHFLQQLQGL